MKVIIVLATHGAPPNDFPKEMATELFALRAQVRKSADPEIKHRLNTLDATMRAWPRNRKNDPFHASSQGIARELHKATGYPVILAFNEFCNPDVESAIGEAISKKADKVVVVTTMMTRGGSHSKDDIPIAIRQAQVAHPKVPILYAWPFKAKEISKLLAQQVESFL